MADINMLNVFVSLAQLRSFRATAERLGITRPAVSQALRRLETGLGIALVRRTTRSVSLTEAGQALYDRIAPAIGTIDEALRLTREMRSQPQGQLRLAVSSIAESFISGPLLVAFTQAHPHVELDITVTDEEFDIVAEGYDAGVRLGEVVHQDMIAVPVSDGQRQLVVASPAYLERHAAPRHPRDLATHRCIGWRPAPGVAPYRWEFAENGRAFDVSVPSEVTTNDMLLMIRMACAGGGVTFGMAETFRPYIERGELVGLLAQYCPAMPGFFLYYPSRHDMAPKLRALVDHLRDWRRRPPPPNSSGS